MNGTYWTKGHSLLKVEEAMSDKKRVEAVPLSQKLLFIYINAWPLLQLATKKKTHSYLQTTSSICFWFKFKDDYGENHKRS